MPVRKAIGAGRSGGRVIWQTIEEFVNDGCMQMAAALSYYTIFSLPPLLILVILMVEPFLDPERVALMVQQEIGGLIGPEGAAQVEIMIENVTRPGAGGPLATGLSIGAFIFGATVAFAQLQFALNTAWQVGPDPTRGTVKNFLIKRVLSFAMILSIGFLLLVSLVLSALLAAFGDLIELWMPGMISATLLHVVNNAVSLTVITLLFAAMFRFLPDARVKWRYALLGGFVTAVLFNLGRLGISIYLGQSDVGTMYGAAGSLAVVLVWVYYSSMILLLGAEFTQVWARFRGDPINPVEGAVRIVHREERYEPEEVPPEKLETVESTT